jgi:hypothetical protein
MDCSPKDRRGRLRALLVEQGRLDGRLARLQSRVRSVRADLEMALAGPEATGGPHDPRPRCGLQGAPAQPATRPIAQHVDWIVPRRRR